MKPSLSDRLCDELKRQLAGAKTVRVPVGGDLLWRWFSDLDRRRQWFGADACPIGDDQIMHYAHAMRWPIQPRHIDILTAMDRVVLDYYLDQKAKASGSKVVSSRTSKTVSPEMFDAMFG